MPSPWKKASFGGIPRLLVSSLRSKTQRGVGDSPLVVQAGFPTSVADFVVKNRSRLRKPPRWGRQRGPGGGGGDGEDGGCSTMAVLTSEIVAAATADGGDNDSEVLSSPWGPPPEVDDSAAAEECGDLVSLIRPEALKDESLPGLLGSKAPESDGPQAFPSVPKLLKVKSFEGLNRSKATKDGVDQGIPRLKAEKDESFPSSAPSEPRESSPTAVARRAEARRTPPAPEEEERKVLGGGGVGGFMVAVKVAFLMLILAVVSKKIAVAVSVSTFAILFAESVGKRLIPLLGPCEEAKKSLGAIAGRVAPPDLTQPPGESPPHVRGGIPILLASIGEPDLSSFRSGRNWVAESHVNAAAPNTETASRSLEEKDSVEIEGCRGGQEVSTANRKKEKKKTKKKLFKNFVQNKLLSSRALKGGKAVGKLEPSNLGEAPGQKGAEEEAVEEEEEEEEEEEDDDRDVNFVREKIGEPSKGGSEHLIFFVLILCGLIRGRVVALFLTVIWYSLVSSARSLWRGRN